MKAKVTIADVARAAGVSTSTVSHVINSTRWVSPETAAAVRDAIASIGYRPNTLAQSLARKNLSSVGIALSTSVNPYFNEVAATIEKAFAALGLMVFLVDTEENPEREMEVVKALHGMQVAGIIMAPCRYDFNDAIEYLKSHAVPTVLVDRRSENSGFDFVASENSAAISDLVALLAARGHGSIGLALGQSEFSSSIERIDGYRAGLDRAGIAFDASLVVSGCVDVEASIAPVASLLTRPARPTAMIGGNNLSTIAIVAAARRAGLAIPGDLSVVGFDDFEWADHFEPRLTLMAQPWQEIAQRASDLLLKRINGDEAGPRVVRCGTRIRHRDSVGRPLPVALAPGTGAGAVKSA